MVPIVIILGLAFVGIFIYLIELSSISRHYDNLIRESKSLEKDVILKRSQVLELNCRIDYYRNRLEEINVEYVSKKMSKNKK